MKCPNCDHNLSEDERLKELATKIRQYLKASPLERNLEMIRLASDLEVMTNKVLGVPPPPEKFHELPEGEVPF